MTESATRFVTPITFQRSESLVHTSIWEHVEASDPQHIATASGADSLWSRAAWTACPSGDRTGGRRGDACVECGRPCEDAGDLAPAMNEVMWSQPATQRNLRRCEATGLSLSNPAGRLAGR